MAMDALFLELIPLARSILWSPVTDGPRRPATIPFRIFLAQRALVTVHGHLATAPRGGQGLLGVLVGDLCECPETKISYLVIDEAIRLDQAVYGDRTKDVLTGLWSRVEAQLEQSNARLLGWYHSHPPLGIGLSSRDVETHEQYFREPWQVALVLSAGGDPPAGGFFRAGADVSWPSACLPFYELLQDDSFRPDGKKRSFVTWKNYRAYNAVAAPPSQAQAPAAGPGEPAVFPRAPTPTIAAGTPPAAAPGGPRSASAAAVGVPPPPPVVPEAPFVPAAAVPREPDPPPEPELRTFVARRSPPVTLAGPEADVRPTGSHRRGWLAALVVVLLAAAAGLYFRFRPALVEGSPPASASQATSSPSPSSSPSPPPVTVSPELARLDQIGEALVQTVQSYNDRAQRQASCAELAQGLVAVEQRWIAYNAAAKSVNLAQDSVRAGKDQSLYGNVDSVESHFDRSGCARP